ncbi:MAG: DegT/DnrJ/EryC1/StrS family aminotransferase [Acidobacteriota bacterium]
MYLPPLSRSRFYGWPANYFRVARDELTGRVYRGIDVETFEDRVAETIGVAHAVAVPQARVGIYTTLKALIEPGQTVIMSPYTIYDVVNMVICAGGRPLFADIDRETCNIDPDEVEKLIDDSTGAVMVTHLHGLACDMDRLVAMCARHDVPLLEDSAQAFGCRLGGRNVGGFGRAGIFSFGMAKNINSLYGGMVTTNDYALANAVREQLAEQPSQERDFLRQRAIFCLIGDLATHPLPFRLLTNWVFRYGYLNNVDALNRRVRGEDEPVRRDALPDHYLRQHTPMQARLALAQLDKVPVKNRRRQAIAEIYHAGLSDIDDLILPPRRDDGSHIYLVYPIQYRDRHKLLRQLMQKGRDLTIQHMGNCAGYECFADFARDCPAARATADSVLLLPTYPGYGRREAEKNVREIRCFFGK